MKTICSPMDHEAIRHDHDTLGDVSVPATALWSAQTERSRHNFRIGGPAEVMPAELIRALCYVKAAAAQVNYPYDESTPLAPAASASGSTAVPLSAAEKGRLIHDTALEIASGDISKHFPLVIFQTGSGTQTNMNVNEVIANRINSRLGLPLGRWSSVHPNDDVNRSQSSNDTFPTAVHVAAALLLRNELLPALGRLRAALAGVGRKYQGVIKIGRTHLQDATPLTVGQEFSGYASQVADAIDRLRAHIGAPRPRPHSHSGATETATATAPEVEEDADIAVPEYVVPFYALPALSEAPSNRSDGYYDGYDEDAIAPCPLPPLLRLAQGGTAVGTGLNTVEGFDVSFAASLRRVISALPGSQHQQQDSKAAASGFALPFAAAPNKFAELAGADAAAGLAGDLTAAATAMHKIANDIRYLASGPRAGLGELTLPANEPGSSIMPGKVNPTQCEAVAMVCARVVGNGATVAFAAAGGQFELNTYRPVIGAALVQSIKLLADVANSFTDHCVVGIKVNKDRVDSLMRQSLMLVTALNPHIGYEKAASAAKLAHREGITLKEAAVDRLKLMPASDFERWVDPSHMIGPAPAAAAAAAAAAAGTADPATNPSSTTSN